MRYFVNRIAMPYKIRANIKHIVSACTWLQNLWTTRNHPGLGKLPPHLLRDIGLTEADVAQLNTTLPSQQQTHPRL